MTKTRGAIPPETVSPPEQWRATCLHYPQEYRSHITGVLRLLGFGYYWDKALPGWETARDIGKAILYDWLDDHPCDEDCPDCPDQPSEPVAPIVLHGSITLEGDDDMGQVVTDVKLVNGKLRIYYGHCCFEDLDLSGLGSGSTGGGGSTVDPDFPDMPRPDDVTEDDWRCRKAAAIAGMFDDLANGLLAAQEGDPISGIALIKAALPYTDMSTTAASKLAIAALAFDSLFLDIDLVWTADQTERLRCELAKVMQNSLTISDTEWAALKNGVARQAGAIPGAFWSGINAGVIDDLTSYLGFTTWDGVIEIVTRNRFRQAVQAGIYANVDCNCPDAPAEVPDGLDWSYVFDFTKASNGFTGQNPSVSARDSSGFHLLNPSTGGGGAFYWERASTTGVDNCVIKYARVDYREPAGATAYQCWTGLGMGSFLEIAGVTGSGGLKYIERDDLNVAWGDSTPVRIHTDSSFVPEGITLGYVRRLVIGGTGDDPFTGA